MHLGSLLRNNNAPSSGFHSSSNKNAICLGKTVGLLLELSSHDLVSMILACVRNLTGNGKLPYPLKHRHLSRADKVYTVSSSLQVDLPIYRLDLELRSTFGSSSGLDLINLTNTPLYQENLPMHRLDLAICLSSDIYSGWVTVLHDEEFPLPTLHAGDKKGIGYLHKPKKHGYVDLAQMLQAND